MMKLNLKINIILLSLFISNACGIASEVGKVPQIYTIQVNQEQKSSATIKLPKEMIVSILDFSGNSMINTIRVAILNDNNRVRYAKNATWVDTPPIMMNQQLNELLQNYAENLVVANYQERIKSQYRLQGQLLQFYYNDIAHEIVVKLDLKLVHMPGQKLLAQKQFVSMVKVDNLTLPEIMKGFDKASSIVLYEARDWVVSNLLN